MKIKMSDIIEYLKIAIYGLFIYLKIDIEVFMILVIFMVIDSVAGSIKAIVLGEKFKFKILFWGITLKFLFLIIPLSVALLGKALGRDLNFGVDVIMKMMIVSEFFSFTGNLYSAKTKKPIENVDFISMLLISLRKGAKRVIDRFLLVIETDIKDEKSKD